GIKKEVNYGIETDGVRNGYTVRYDLGGEKEKNITVNLPGAELPLILNKVRIVKLVINKLTLIILLFF
ncbi:hypothetical protein S9M_00581, partial [Enterococcus faecalis EnGen0111]|uniref:hypothetical protein n=1 Tax=Enterococcus faecalis TaxID=1351 RepID=UPI00032D7085